MIYDLPNELIHIVFKKLDSYQDHVHLSLTCQKMASISLSCKLRCALLEKFFSSDDCNQDLVNDPSLFSALCEFVEAAKINPISKNLMQVLEQQIETSHFVDYHDINDTKSIILDVFRSQCQVVSSTLISNPIDKNSKSLTARHITLLHGPRRVYYDIELPFAYNETKRFKCVFYDLHSVVAFAEDDLTVYRGCMQFKDENLLSDVTWSSIFEAKNVQVNNMVISPPLDTSLSTPRDVKITSGNKSLLVSNAYQKRLDNVPSTWIPCLLRTYEQCMLRAPVKKGGLVKGQQFEYAFMYENQADDTICLEFCTVNSSKQPVPRGYLLMKESAIEWTN